MLLDELIESGGNLQEGIELNTKLSDAEKSICQYIIEHLDQVPYMSSRELARLTYSNPTSILRLSRKIGYANFNDFKFDIVLKLRDMHMPKVELDKNDSGLECINKTAQLYDNVIARTKNNILLAQYDEIIDVLNKCEAIDIIATDMNADIAHYAQHILMPIGICIFMMRNFAPGRKLRRRPSAQNTRFTIMQEICQRHGCWNWSRPLMRFHFRKKNAPSGIKRC